MTREETLRAAQEVTGYQFQDLSILQAALTHASVANTRLESNERLEFLGDAILGLVVCEELFHRHDRHLEGELTKIKSVVVSRRVCAKVADEMGLSDLLFLGKGMRERAGLPMSLRAASFEALIAAIYLDGGMKPAKEFILHHAGPAIDEASSSENHHNYKSYLQQYTQKYLAVTPRYEWMDEQGPDHSKCFQVCVCIAERRFQGAWGASKKEAEQRAAYLALAQLKNEDADGMEESDEFYPTLADLSPFDASILEPPAAAG